MGNVLDKASDRRMHFVLGIFDLNMSKGNVFFQWRCADITIDNTETFLCNLNNEAISTIVIS